MMDEDTGLSEKTLHQIRHENARYLLDAEAEGKVKRFSELTGKNDRQCSNFLRENNPVNIGSTIARQIEKAFKRPNGWMDLEHSTGLKSSKTSYVYDILLNDLRKKLEDLQDQAESDTDVYMLFHAHHELQQFSKRVTNIQSAIWKNMEEMVAPEAWALIEKLTGESAAVNDYEVECLSCRFIITPFPQPRAFYRDRYFHHSPSDPELKKEYTLTPITVDNQLKFFVSTITDSTNKYQMMKILRTKGRNLEQSDITDCLDSFIDDHPHFDKNEQINS